MVLVDTDADLRRDQGRLRGHAHRSLEPAGALARGRRSSATSQRNGARGETLVAIACGANMNFDRLRFVAERAEIGEQREALFGGDDPRATAARFKRFCDAASASAAITEFNYRIADAERGARLRRRDGARPRARRDAHRARSFAAHGFRDARPDRQRDGQAARAPHGRRARGAGAATSVLYRFEFPERPGALMQFPHARWARAGTSACSTTATTAPTTAASWSACRCRGARWATSGAFSTRSATRAADETRNPAYRLFLR